MKNDTTILPFRQSALIADPLTELAREGARRMLAEALKAEADAFVASFADEQLEDGRQRIVRHGFGPDVCTGCCSQVISGMFSEVAHMYPAC